MPRRFVRFPDALSRCLTGRHLPSGQCGLPGPGLGLLRFLRTVIFVCGPSEVGAAGLPADAGPRGGALAPPLRGGFSHERAPDASCRGGQASITLGCSPSGAGSPSAGQGADGGWAALVSFPRVPQGASRLPAAMCHRAAVRARAPFCRAPPTRGSSPLEHWGGAPGRLRMALPPLRRPAVRRGPPWSKKGPPVSACRWMGQIHTPPSATCHESLGAEAAVTSL